MQNKSCMQFGVAMVTVVSNGYLKSLYTITRYLNSYDIDDNVEQSSYQTVSHYCKSFIFYL